MGDKRNIKYYGLFTVVMGFLLFIATSGSGIQFSITAASFPVLDGKEQAVIVYGDAASGYEINAYNDLKSYLGQATGKNFEIMTESAFNSSGKKFPIYIGNCTATQQAIGSQLAALDRDGFMIIVESKRVFLAGPKDYSTYWAVVQFLEDYVGVRWLLPGTLGEDVLSRNKILVSPVRRTEKPLILSRAWSGDTIALGGTTWSLRQRIHARYKFHHNTSNIFPPDTYCSSHPEYYTWYNGSRVCGAAGTVNIDYTEPGTVTLAVQTARNTFNSDHDAESFSFAQDDGTKWCQCSPTSPSPAVHSAPYCSQLFVNTPYPNTDYWNIWGGKSRAGDLFYYWLNQIAQQIESSHPTKICGTLAYGGNTCPPLTMQPYHTIMPYICGTLADTYTPDYGSQIRWLIDSWSSYCDRIGLYDYAYGSGNYQPRIYTKQVQTMIKYGYEHKLRGVYAEVYPNWGLDGPRLYQTARIWWNPYADINDIFNDWNERMFKEAAGPMKSFFSRCEEAWLTCDHYLREPAIIRLGMVGAWKVNGYPVFYQGWRTSPYEIYTPAFISELTGYLDQAAAIATTQIVKDRIQFYRKTWDLGLDFTNAYWAGEGADLLVARGTTLLQLVDSLKKMPPSYNLDYFIGQINTRIGTDYVAHYPDSNDIISTYNLSKPASSSTYQWCGSQIAADALTLPLEQRKAYIDQRIANLFGTSDYCTLRQAVAQIRKAACDHAGVPLVPPTPQGNLIAYFKLDETSGCMAYNSNGIHYAVLAGNINWVNDPQRGRCVEFDGDGHDHLIFDTIVNSLYKDLTITCWTKVADVTRTTGFIEGWTNAGVRKVLSYLPVNYAGNRNIVWNGSSDGGQIVVSPSSIGYTSNNTWYHWAFTKNGTTGELKLYLNGVKKTTVFGNTDSLTDLTSIGIGTMNTVDYKGLLDDVSFWNKALSDAEVQDIYTNGIN